MAKPRVFVSSTYYDLRYIRNDLEKFIEGMGYEPVLFESGDIPFRNDSPLDESCYEEIKNSDMQILIIGGRYGSKASSNEDGGDVSTDNDRSKDYNSITKNEYLTAIKNNIPIFIFIDKNVHVEYETYKVNKMKKDVEYAYVDSINIFKLIELLLIRGAGNYLKDFENFDDIASWLKDQWAGIFAGYLSKRRYENELKALALQIEELESITNALKVYMTEIMTQILPTKYEKIVTEQEAQMDNFKASKFCSEPLINDLISVVTVSDTIGADKLVLSTKLDEIVDADDFKVFIYNIFKQSDRLEAFLEGIGVTKGNVETLMSLVGEDAEYEYLKYREQYLGEKLGMRLTGRY